MAALHIVIKILTNLAVRQDFMVAMKRCFPCLLILLTRLKQGWINSGIIKMLCMISKHSCKEREVVASVYMKNLSK